VVVTGRRPEPIEAVAAGIAGVSVAGDTSDPAHAAEGVAAAVSAFGGLDVVVASAGDGIEGSVGHNGRLGARDDVTLHQQYMADIAGNSRKAIDTVDPTPCFQKYEKY
jgi:NAD(P)-dependent dehydrogenase (short-subunit alcohol dehydrogenase family)